MTTESLKHAMYFGLIIGVAFFLNFLVGVYPSVSFLQFLFLILIPYLGYKFTVDCRKKVFGGVMTYGQAFFYEFQLFFYGSFISAALKVIYLKYLNPNYLQTLIDASEELMESIPMYENLDVMPMIESIYQPVSFSLYMFFINLMVGVFVSLITAAIVYKKPTPFDTPEA